ncbi:RecX family transcriptional regulator [Vibrio genomosp. F10]|uniref:Regulatory protein RecX n=1 Tax=Vibrio genomosp. F10 TaxID=723171 RepID=A0A1B9QV77_9VIBR|nr:RecX family transcriptional regulator [Vibrio genomosp. F10]OCH72771.1 recombinase A [Vibrio genomosp. F10]OEE94233.1 recombinase A [Vibrio genomosp. F10 str. 9ZD137]
MNSAMWHLGQRDLTESELINKLRIKTDNEDWITQTIEKLRRLDYLKPDNEFAEQFAERAFSSEYGSGYILEKLKKKGIAGALIQEAIEKVKQERQIDEQTILTERVNHYYQEFTMSKEKLVAALQKRGFSYAQINESLRQHPSFAQLRSNLEIKAEKADLEKEVLKYVRKGKGLTVIRQELRQRKIDVTDLDALIGKLVESGEIDFYSACLEQLEKKSYDLNIHKERSKAYAMLSRKGFSSEEIQFALSEIN